MVISGTVFSIRNLVAIGGERAAQLTEWDTWYSSKRCRIAVTHVLLLYRPLSALHGGSYLRDGTRQILFHSMLPKPNDTPAHNS